jgi:hypothetical protein
MTLLVHGIGQLHSEIGDSCPTLLEDQPFFHVSHMYQIFFQYSHMYQLVLHYSHMYQMATSGRECVFFIINQESSQPKLERSMLLELY